MKIEKKTKKGLRTNFTVSVDKKIIQKKIEERLNELQTEVNLKGFRPGKVPPNVIKSQFGKAVYGDVIDKILKESSSKAIENEKIKVAGQPKIDLKTFGEGKDLSYTLEVDSLPEIKLKKFDNIQGTEYHITADNKLIDERIKEIAERHKKFEDKNINETAKLGDQISFDYTATIDGNKFEGSEGKGVQIELGKDLFLKGFDNQLIGAKKNETKKVESTMPPNHPKKELANKKTIFTCKILNIKFPSKNKIDDEFAKNVGAKNLSDLKKIIEKQISSQYKQALDAITKKEILDQIEKLHNFDLPQVLVNNEIDNITRALKKEEKEKHKEKNEKLAKSRIKLGLLLNELREKNGLKVNENDIKNEIEKHARSMPGQEKMVIDFYQKNQSALASLRGTVYEEKIITAIKAKAKANNIEVTKEEAEKILKESQKNENEDIKEKKPPKEKKAETKKTSIKKSSVKSIKSKPKTKKVSKK